MRDTTEGLITIPNLFLPPEEDELAAYSRDLSNKYLLIRDAHFAVLRILHGGYGILCGVIDSQEDDDIAEGLLQVHFEERPSEDPSFKKFLFEPSETGDPSFKDMLLGKMETEKMDEELNIIAGVCIVHTTKEIQDTKLDILNAAAYFTLANDHPVKVAGFVAANAHICSLEFAAELLSFCLLMEETQLLELIEDPSNFFFIGRKLRKYLAKHPRFNSYDNTAVIAQLSIEVSKALTMVKTGADATLQPKDLMTTKRAVETFGVSRSTLVRAVKSGKITSHRSEHAPPRAGCACFFYARPILFSPTRDGLFVAFAGPAFGLLTRPTHLLQKIPYVGGCVRHPQSLFDHLGDARQGPEFSAIPCRPWAFQQHLFELFFLAAGQT